MNRNLSALRTLSNDKRLHALKGLSALAKFLGVYTGFRELVKTYGLKWTLNNDDVILARLARTCNIEDLVRWIKPIKDRIPTFNVFMDFITVTGLRFDEAINSYNLIVDRNREYYNVERQLLEHFRFRQLFIRRTKKVFISFVPENLITRIESPITYDTIKKRLQRRHLKSRFAEIRELYASYSTKHLRQPEIDFIQGRTSTSVFMRNYFNPAWISDLKDRALKNAGELLALVSATKT
jgi:hypothetical protein